MVQSTLPSGATQSRSPELAYQIEDYFFGPERENTDTLFTVTGFGFGGSGQNSGLAFMSLAPWDERPGDENGVVAITQRASRTLAGVRDAQVFALTPPPVRGLGQSSGFTLELLNTGNLGSIYINDFVDRGRVKRVYLQGDAPPAQADSDDFVCLHLRRAAARSIHRRRRAQPGGDRHDGAARQVRRNGARHLLRADVLRAVRQIFRRKERPREHWVEDAAPSHAE
jgi:hypothetical protein